MKEKQELFAFNLRLPVPVAEQVKVYAKAEHSSVNRWMLVTILEKIAKKGGKK